ncbi:MAG: hypothetical protein ACPGVO_16975 [Spirulinaceae cyanobacterium]
MLGLGIGQQWLAWARRVTFSLSRLLGRGLPPACLGQPHSTADLPHGDRAGLPYGSKA